MLRRVPAIGFPSLVGSIRLVASVAFAYFLAAQFSLALLTPDGVAVFWPAAGIALGTLIALGPGAWWPVAFGVVAATFAANLLGDRNLASTAVFALCNAGDTLLIAWLIESHFGSGFTLDSSRGVLGLFLATTVGAAISGIGGTAGFILFHSPEAPILTTWLNWFASDAIGVITVAPLVIGLARTLHDPPETSELKEGSLALVVLAVVSAIGFGAPKHYWFTILPLSLLFPLLLWPAAHCRPVFAAAAAFIVALAVVGTITFGIGRLGDPSMRLADRVHAAEMGLLAVSACALVLAALFAERRHNEGALKHSNEALKDSNDRLQLALDGAELGVWSVDAKTGRFENDMRDRWIHRHPPDLPSKTVEEVRSFIHPDDLPNLDAAFAASSRAGGSCKIEYRLAPELRQPGAGQERWIAVEGTVVRGADGRPVRIIGVTRDVTERKRAEEQQRVLMAELDHRVKNVLATVSAVAGHTLETSSSMSHFVAALDGRIRSMASAHEVLSIQRWQGMPLAELVRRELAAYSTSSNTAVDGPDVMLIAEAGQAMAMVIHELVTNAAKYGALSTQSGRVSVRWYRKLNGSAQLVFVWKETGGPRVRAPKKSGYGTGVVRDLVAYEFGGAVDLSFAPEGVRCRLEIPIDRISSNSGDTSGSEQHHSGRLSSALPR